MDPSESGNEFTVHAATIHNVTYNVMQTAVSATSVQEQQATSERPSSAALLDANRGANGFQIYTLEVECEALLNSSRHFQAVEHLKRLHEFQPNHIKTMMMLAECYFNLDKFDDCFEIAKEIRKTILKPPQPETRDLITQGDKCKQTKQRLTSLVLLWSCCSIFQARHNSRSAIAGISECVHKMDDIGQDVANEMTREEISSSKLLTRFCSFFLLMMQDTERLIEEIETTDKDLQTRVLLRCRGCQGDCFRDLHRNDEAIELYNRCIEQVENQFGSNASKLYMYGEFLSSVGGCYVINGECDTGVMFLRKAQTALEKCEPRNDEEISRRRELSNDIENIFEESDTSSDEEIASAQSLNVEGILKQLQEGDNEVGQPRNQSTKEGKFTQMIRFFRKRK